MPVKTVAQELLDLSIREKLRLAKYESWVVGKMVGLLNASDADLERRISMALERSAPLDTTERLAAIRKELVAANLEAYQKLGYFISNQMQALVEEQATHLAVSLERTVPFKFSATRPPATLLKALVTEDPLQGRLLSGISADGVNSHIENLAGNRATALLNELKMGVVQGESWGQILTRIRGTAAGNYRDGVLENIGRRQAEVLTRTAVQHFTEAARDMLIQENGDLFQGVMWVSTLDRRTTQICQQRDGKVWDLDYRPVGHNLDWLNGPGRAHWQCRSTSVPVLKDVQELQKIGFNLRGLDPGERAALDNPVPITTGYEDWLRDQPFSVQADALSSQARAEEFRDGASLDQVWDMRFDRMPAEAPDRGVPVQTSVAPPPAPPAPIDLESLPGADSLPAGDEDGTVQVPFDEAPAELAHQAELVTERGDYSELVRNYSEVQEISMADLLVTQGNVDAAKVDELVTFFAAGGQVGPSAVNDLGQLADLPLVIRTDGHYIVVDGHHRLTADWLLGKSSATVRVLIW